MKSVSFLCPFLIFAASMNATAEDKVLGPIIAIKRTTKFDAKFCQGKEKWKTDGTHLFCDVDQTVPLDHQWIGQATQIGASVGGQRVQIVSTLSGYQVILVEGAKVSPEEAEAMFTALVEANPEKQLETIVFSVREDTNK